MIRALLVLAIAGALVLCYRRWWLAVRWIMVLLVLEGAVRKWILPGQQQLVYLAKDFLLAGVYLGFLSARQRVRRVRVSPGIQALIVLCALWGAFEIFNPRLPSLLVGIFGWKAYFWYVPLVWVVPAAFRDLPSLERFLRMYALLALPMAVLALAQFRAPVSSVLNRYAWGEGAGETAAVATFGEAGAARVTGTFSYITGYTTFLVLIAVVSMVALGLRGFRIRGNAVLWSCLLTVPVGVLLSGSRGPLVLLAGLFPLFFLFSRRGTAERAKAAVRLASAGAIAAALVSYVALPALEAYAYRVRTTEENLVERALGPVIDPVDMATEVGPLGYGIGATHQAASALVPGVMPGSWLDGLLAEAESTRIMIELGPVGFLSHYAYRVGVVLLAFGVARRSRHAAGRVVSLGSAFFLLAQVPGAIVFNVYAAFYFWFFVGAAMLVRATEGELAAERGTRARSRSMVAVGRSGASV